MKTLSSFHEQVAAADSPMCDVAVESQSLDRTLTEIRSGRRLEKIVKSIENFLHSQISRIDKVLEECRLAEDNDKILQKILQDFEQEKLDWEETRHSESLRLVEASDKLIQGWQELEDERRRWLDQRS
jgi:hypothetical protein